MRRFNATAFLLLGTLLFSQVPISRCGTPDPTAEQINAVNDSIQVFLNDNNRTPDYDAVNVLVAWHVIYSSQGQGNIPDWQIEEAIENAIKNPKDLIQKIVLFNKDLHPYCDGKSSVRVIDESINFLHKDKNYLKIKPLNLIRKFKIRKKLKKFTFKSYGKAFTLKR